MKTLFVSLAGVLSLCLIMPNMAVAYPVDLPQNTTSQSVLADDRGESDDDDDDGDCARLGNLSSEQKKVLESLYDQFYNVNRELIENYAKNGALTKEQKDRNLRHLKNYVQSAKKNNFSVCIEFEHDELEYKLSHGHRGGERGDDRGERNDRD